MFFEYRCSVSGINMVQSSTLYEDVSEVITDDRILSDAIEAEIVSFARDRLDKRRLRKLIGSDDRYISDKINCVRIHYFSRELKAIVFEKTAQMGYYPLTVLYASGSEHFYFVKQNFEKVANRIN